MMDPDSDFTFTNQTAAKNYAKFYPKWVRNNFQSEKQGQEVGEHKDYIIIISPGQPKSEVNRPVQEKDKQDYPAEWQAYQAGREQRISGTPVELLPGLPIGRADAMKAIYIYTIEQLAELSEPAMHKVGMGASELKAKAQAYLQKNSAEVHSLKAEIAKRDDTIKQLAERLTALEAKPKRGRPPKEAP